VSERRPAAFLDRDGTIIHDVDYISRPEDVRMVRGAAAAIARLNDAGIPVIIVSNQSGIGRGYFNHDAFERVQARIEELLGVRGAHIDATYICPHAPADPPTCLCRKPRVALFEQAARDHDIDLARSWYAGDKWRDVEPGRTLGGSAFLIPAPSTPPEDLKRARALGIVRRSLAQLVQEMIIALTGGHGRR
jgi:D-glycero-D-manno-heptose 1,7-bisphosphate phosphatase